MVQRGLALGVVVLVGVGILAVYFTFNPVQHHFPPCPFQLLTGWYCPGCGSQRAAHALLHGRVAQAASFNLLALAYLPILAIGAGTGARSWLSGQPRQSGLLYRPWLGWLTVALTVTFAVLRNLPGALGSWLAP